MGLQKKHFLTIPGNEPIHYILDNLNTHCKSDFKKKIEHEPGPKRKTKARIALEELVTILFNEENKIEKEKVA